MDIDFDALKTTYYEYVEQINNKFIEHGDSSFYQKMAESIFEATKSALDPAKKHMHIVPAQTGSGKSSYMRAMVAALCDCSYSCAVLSKTINQVQDSYEVIATLLNEPRGMDYNQYLVDLLEGKDVKPRRVLPYTSVHKQSGSLFVDNLKFNPEEVEKFTRRDKIIAPVVISTHASLMIELETGEDTGILKQLEVERDVIYLDETPDFVISGIIGQSEIESVRDILFEVDKKGYGIVGKLQKVYKQVKESDDKSAGQFATLDDLWDDALETHFLSLHEAGFQSESKNSLMDIFDRKGQLQLYSDFINFLKCLKDGSYFMLKNNGKITYSRNIFKDNPKYILLDATAEIEGFRTNHSLPENSLVGSPEVDYSNLRVSCFQSPTGIKEGYGNQSTSYIYNYSKYILEKIVEFTEEGEEVLVIAKKNGIDRLHKQLRGNAYHPAEYEERRIYFIHHGNFIGENNWGGIRKVFLFSGYIRPKSLYISELSTFNGGISNFDLKSQSGSSLLGEVLEYQDNQMLKWFKQLSARGNIRNISGDGKAGEMELYTDVDPLWIMKFHHYVFPGSPKLRFHIKDLKSIKKRTIRFAHYLYGNKEGICTYQDVADALEMPNYKHMKRFLNKPEVSYSMRYLGWQSVNKSKVPLYEGEGTKRIVNFDKYFSPKS